MHPLVFVTWNDLWSPPQALLASPKTTKRLHVLIPQQDLPSQRTSLLPGGEWHVPNNERDRKEIFHYRLRGSGVLGPWSTGEQAFESQKTEHIVRQMTPCWARILEPYLDQRAQKCVF